MCLLTAYAQTVSGGGGLDLLSDWIVGSTFVRPFVILGGVCDLQVPRWHDEVIPYSDRQGAEGISKHKQTASKAVRATKSQCYLIADEKAEEIKKQTST